MDDGWRLQHWSGATQSNSAGRVVRPRSRPRARTRVAPVLRFVNFETFASCQAMGTKQTHHVKPKRRRSLWTKTGDRHTSSQRPCPRTAASSLCTGSNLLVRQHSRAEAWGSHAWCWVQCLVPSDDPEGHQHQRIYLLFSELD